MAFILPILPYLPAAIDIAEASFTLVELGAALIPGVADLGTVATVVSAGLDGGLTTLATETALTAGGEIAAGAAARKGAAIAVEKVTAKLTKKVTEEALEKGAEKAIKKGFIKTFSKKIGLFIAKFGIKGVFGLISLILSLTLFILQYFFNISVGAYVSKKVKELIFGKLEDKKIELEKVLHFKVAGLAIISAYRAGKNINYDPYWETLPDGSKLRRPPQNLEYLKERKKIIAKAKKDALLIVKTLKKLGYTNDPRMKTINHFKKLVN